MPRTVVTIKTNASQDSILHYLTMELPKFGYSDKSTLNERAWGKGDGVMVMAQRIAVTFQPGEVFLSAWVYTYAIGEVEITKGITGKPLKNKLKKVLEHISAGIKALPPSQTSSGPAVSPDIVYCSACGNPCPSGSAFCNKCGSRLLR
jgi:hypothetical protein